MKYKRCKSTFHKSGLYKKTFLMIKIFHGRVTWLLFWLLSIWHAQSLPRKRSRWMETPFPYFFKGLLRHNNKWMSTGMMMAWLFKNINSTKLLWAVISTWIFIFKGKTITRKNARFFYRLVLKTEKRFFVILESPSDSSF